MSKHERLAAFAAVAGPEDDEDAVEGDQTEIVEKDGSGGESKGRTQ